MLPKDPFSRFTCTALLATIPAVSLSTVQAAPAPRFRGLRFRAPRVRDKSPLMADGLESDTANRVYLTKPETNSISRRLPNTLFETLARDPRLIWPDTMSLAGNGDLYVMVKSLRDGQPVTAPEGLQLRQRSARQALHALRNPHRRHANSLEMSFDLIFITQPPTVFAASRFRLREFSI